MASPKSYKEINERLAIMETKLDSIEGDTKRIYKSVHGNGKVGLKTQVEINEEKLESIDGILKDHQTNVKWIIVAGRSIMTCITGILNYMM